MDGIFYKKLVSIVPKINHSRPYLTFIDNLDREKGKKGARQPLVDSVKSEQRTARYTQKLKKVQFAECQWEMVLELFLLISEYHEHTTKIISRNSKKAKLKRNETYSSIVDVLARIFSYDMNLSRNNGKCNIQDFIDALQYYFEKNDDDITWDLLRNHALTDATAESLRRVFGLIT